MGQAISEVIPFAVGIAISPVPIIAVILMLFSSRARVNGPAFLAGWAAGLAALSAAVYAIASAADVGSDAAASDSVSWLKIALGVLLLVLAARDWRHRPAPGETPEMPKWMAKVDSLAPGKALVLGILLSSVNPKNLVLTIGAAAGLAQADIPTSDAVVALIVFVLLASLATAALVGYYFVGGAAAKARLDELKGWLGIHSTAVMAVLFLVFGAVLIARGLAPLTA